MISLYFNCRVTGRNLISNGVGSGFFYPIIYPKNSQDLNLTQVEVLLNVIKSYSSINFDIAVFNISIDSQDIESIANISKAIEEHIKANKIVASFARPSSLKEWQCDLARVSKLIGANSPVLIVMNHDHAFVDYTPLIFNQIIENIFPESSDNFGKALLYSHAPESIAELINGRYCLTSDGIPYKQKVSKDLSSILVMTMETLDSYILSIDDSSDYIGRLIDWPGVTYQSFTLKVFNFPREFFRHFDGYGHVTGLRGLKDSRQDLAEVQFLDLIFDVSALVDFYYTNWINCFMLYIRDELSINRNFYKTEKDVFISSIENSLILFQRGYIEADCDSGILPAAIKDTLKNALRSQIYYQANELYLVLSNEITLMRPRGLKNFIKIKIKYIRNLLPFYLINQIKLLHKLKRKRNIE